MATDGAVPTTRNPEPDPMLAGAMRTVRRRRGRLAGAMKPPSRPRRGAARGRGGPGGYGPAAMAAPALKVAIDATPLLGPRTGVGVFVRGLLLGLTAPPDRQPG